MADRREARNIRVSIATAIALLGCAVVAAAALAPRAGAGSPGDELLPDLQTEPITGVRLERRTVSPGERRWFLRFDNTISNHGAGPLELVMQPATAAECPDGSQPETNQRAYQRIYEDTDGNDEFDRNPPADLVERNKDAGCVIYHPSHGHYHFENLARFDLLPVNTSEGPRDSDKIGFCLLDVYEVDGTLPGSPANRYYGNIDPGASCQAPGDTMGVSVGWADVYHSGTPHQEVKVAGLDKGKYCLRSTADYEGRLDESVEVTNNSTERLLKIVREKRLVRVLSSDCGLP